MTVGNKSMMLAQARGSRACMAFVVGVFCTGPSNRKRLHQRWSSPAQSAGGRMHVQACKEHTNNTFTSPMIEAGSGEERRERIRCPAGDEGASDGGRLRGPHRGLRIASSPADSPTSPAIPLTCEARRIIPVCNLLPDTPVRFRSGLTIKVRN